LYLLGQYKISCSNCWEKKESVSKTPFGSDIPKGFKNSIGLQFKILGMWRVKKTGSTQGSRL